MPEEPAFRRPLKLRIEGLSDIVFGLALSIGALALISSIPQSPEALAGALAIFIFSFVLVVISWLLYSRVMSVLPVEVPGALILNLLLLLCVALEPYLLFVTFNSPSLDLLSWSTFAYALDVGLINLLLAGLSRIFLKEVKRPGSELGIHSDLVWRFRRTMFAEFLLAGVFLVSALPFFWVATPGGYLRFDIWYLSIGVVFFWFPRRREPKAAP